MGSAAAARQDHAPAGPSALDRYLSQQREAAASPPHLRALPGGPVSRREVAWAVSITLLLLTGILGTLLLRTSMEGQARTLQRAGQTAASLTDRTQELKRTLTRDADPASLAAKARALRMHPQSAPEFLTSGGVRPAGARRAAGHG